MIAGGGIVRESASRGISRIRERSPSDGRGIHLTVEEPRYGHSVRSCRDRK